MSRGLASPSQSGLSMIELMVAMTLGLMIIVTLGYIMMGSRTTYRTQDASSRLQDTGRFAMDFIGRQLRAAGRIDITPLAGDSRTNSAALPGNWAPISGSHGAAANGGNAAVNTSGVVTINGGTRQTDTVTVQYVLTDSGGTIADCNGGGAGIVLTAIPRTAGAAINYGTVVNMVSLTGANLQLQCTGNGGGGTQPIAEGVEDLQFRYAVVGAPTSFVVPANTWTATNWANVVAVQVCVMVQSTSNGVMSAAQTVTDCSGNRYTPNDTRLRRTFTSVFALRNALNAIP